MTDVLTLALDPDSQAHFEALRQQHFPPERNQIAAHLTLFHTLPVEERVTRELEDTAREQGRFLLEVTGVRSLGKGVAYRLASSTLEALHRRLSRSFTDDLSPQDRQRFQPHIVVQNKVTPEAARALLQRLQASFTPMSVEAQGLELWHYRGGPWELARRFAFGGA